MGGRRPEGLPFTTLWKRSCLHSILDRKGLSYSGESRTRHQGPGGAVVDTEITDEVTITLFGLEDRRCVETSFHSEHKRRLLIDPETQSVGLSCPAPTTSTVDDKGVQRGSRLFPLEWTKTPTTQCPGSPSRPVLFSGQYRTVPTRKRRGLLVSDPVTRVENGSRSRSVWVTVGTLSTTVSSYQGAGIVVSQLIDV